MDFKMIHETKLSEALIQESNPHRASGKVNVFWKNSLKFDVDFVVSIAHTDYGKCYT